MFVVVCLSKLAFRPSFYKSVCFVDNCNNQPNQQNLIQCFLSVNCIKNQSILSTLPPFDFEIGLGHRVYYYLHMRKLRLEEATDQAGPALSRREKPLKPVPHAALPSAFICLSFVSMMKLSFLDMPHYPSKEAACERAVSF